MQLDSIQPTQLYISSEKLDYVVKILKQSKNVDIEPIPVKKLEDQIIFVDGHTRALAALLLGLSEIPVYYWKNEDEELDWDEYKVCIEWCKEEGIHTISDLKNRIVPHKDYQILWLDRCKKMQQDLEAKRKTQRAYEHDT
jgi:hypothetical protein